MLQSEQGHGFSANDLTEAAEASGARKDKDHNLVKAVIRLEGLEGPAVNCWDRRAPFFFLYF